MSNVAIGIDFEAGMCGEPVADRFYLQDTKTGEYLSHSRFYSRFEWADWHDGATSFVKKEASRLIDAFLAKGVHLKPVNVLDC